MQWLTHEVFSSMGLLRAPPPAPPVSSNMGWSSALSHKLVALPHQKLCFPCSSWLQYCVELFESSLDPTVGKRNEREETSFKLSVVRA